MRIAMESLPTQSRGTPNSLPTDRIDDDEDYTGDIGMEEQDRKRAQQGRRGRLVTDLSDSEEENADGGGEGSEAKCSDESDEDMFGGADEEKKATKPGGKYTEPGNISGEEPDALDGPTSLKDTEFNLSRQGSSDEDFLRGVDPEFELESSEEEGTSSKADDDNAMPDAEADDWENDPDNPYRGMSKRQRDKHKKGAGFKIGKFNMKDELDQGRFNEDGVYVENARDPHAEQDSWLKGNYNRKTIKQARQAQIKRQQDREYRPEEKLGVPVLKARLAEFLMRGESVMEALHRIGRLAHPRAKAGTRRGKSKEAAWLGASPDEDEPAAKAAEAKTELEKMTSYASILMSEHGLTAIYDDTYESLVRAARRAKVVGSDWDPARKTEKAHTAEPEPGTHIGGTPSPEAQYVYRYSPSYLAQSGAQEAEVFGPFSGSDLLAWAQQGYFGPNQDRILLQPAPSEGQPNPDQWLAWGAL